MEIIRKKNDWELSFGHIESGWRSTNKWFQRLVQSAFIVLIYRIFQRWRCVASHLFIIAIFYKNLSWKRSIFFFGVCLVRTQSSLSLPLTTVQTLVCLRSRSFDWSAPVCTHRNLICSIQSQFSSSFQRCFITKYSIAPILC